MICVNGRDVYSTPRGQFKQTYPVSPRDFMNTPLRVGNKSIHEFVGRDGEYEIMVKDVEMAVGTQFLIKVNGPSIVTIIVPKMQPTKWKVRGTQKLGLHVDGRMKELQFIDDGPPATLGWDIAADSVIVIEEKKLPGVAVRGLTSGTDVCSVVKESCNLDWAPGPIKVTVYRIIKKEPDVPYLLKDIKRTLPPLDVNNLDEYEAALDRALKKVKSLKELVKYVPRK